MTKKNKQQGLFSEQEQFECACGCRQYGFRSKRGQPRKYINATHKKRAQRAREKDAKQRDIMRYTPAGWLYFFQSGADSLEILWEGMTDDEKAIILCMCERGLNPKQFLETVQKMFGVQKSAIEHNIHVWQEWDHG